MSFGSSFGSGGFGGSSSQGSGFGGGGFGGSSSGGGLFNSSSNNNNSFGGSSFGGSSFGGGQQSSGFAFGGSANANNNAGSSFGSSGGGFGGSGGGFGASSSSTGGFGASGGGFGASGSTGGGFGGSSFGSSNNQGGSGFGGGGSAGFGGSSGGFGGGGSSGFGAGGSSGFGGTSTSSGFGGSSTFGAGSSSGFGAGGSSGFGGGGFSGGGNVSAGQGTGNVPYSSTMDSSSREGEAFVTITAMDAYANKSVEMLRFEDYQQNRKPGSAGGNTGAAAGGGLFGASPSQPQQGGGLFGGGAANQQSGGGLFGTSSGGGFGSTGQQNTGGGGLFGGSTGGGFGSTGAGGGGLFGGSSGAGGGFGSSSGFGGANNNNQQQGGLFGGGAATNNAFGAPNQQSGGGLFGSSNTGGFGSSGGGGGGLFGGASQPQQGGGLFGSSTPPPQQQGGGGLFGSSNTGGGFGSTNTGGGGLFGGGSAQPPGGGLFGSSTPQQQQGGGGLFGSSTPQQQGGGLFGSSAPQQQQGGGLFGSSTPQQQGGGLFGASTPQQGGGLFGGGGSANKFGGSGGGGLFGSSTPNTGGGGGGLFGSSTPNTGGGGLFGSTNTNTGGGGLFGSSAPASGGGLFGSSGTTGAGGGGGLFGGGGSTSGFGSSFQSQQTQQAPGMGGGLFGSSTGSAGFGGSAFGQTAQTQQGGLFQQQNAAQQQQQLALVSTGEPYATGATSQMARHIALAKEAWEPISSEAGNKEKEKTIGAASSAASAKTSMQSTPIGKIQIRPRGYNRTYGAVANAASDKKIGGGLESKTSSKKESAIDHASTGTVAHTLTPGVFDLNKRLSINKANRTSTPQKLSGSAATTTTTPGKKIGYNTKIGSEKSPIPISNGNEEQEEEDHYHRRQQGRSSSPQFMEGKSAEGDVSSEDELETPQKGLFIRSPEEDRRKSTQKSSPMTMKKKPKSALCPRMSDDYIEQGYVMNPSLQELASMNEEELENVADFSVSRKGFGKVEWLGKVDVRGLDVDETITIEHMNIEVYRSEEDTPKRGTKLNRPAICTLEHVEIPSDFDGTKAEFGAWLRDSLTKDLDAVFINFDETSMQWKFKVKHFTRYGFNKDSVAYPSTAKKQKKRNDHPQMEDDETTLSPKHSAARPSSPMEGLPTSDTTMFLDEEDNRPHQHEDRDPSMSSLSREMMTQQQQLQQNSRFAVVDSPVIRTKPPASTIRSFKTSSVFKQPDTVEQHVVEEEEKIDIPSFDYQAGFHFEEFDIPLEEGPLYRQMRQKEEQLQRNKVESVNAYKRQHNPLTRFLPRSFRVSWGPNGEICVPMGNQVRLFKLDVDADPNLERERLAIHSQAARTATQEDDKDQTSHIIVNGLQRMRRMNDLNLHEKLIWDLVNSIWFAGTGSNSSVVNEEEANMNGDGCPDWNDWAMAIPPKNQIVASNQHTVSREWLDSIDAWLIDTLSNENVVPNWKTDIAKALSCKQIERACDLAMDQGNFRLATLIAQAAGNKAVRNLLREQIQNIWEPGSCTELIEPEMLNIYKLLSGDISDEQREENGHWLRALALNIWYTCDPFEPLQNGFNSYLTSFQNGGAPPPRTKWFQEQDDGSNCFDTLYQLFALAANPSHQFVNILNPKGHSANLLSHGLPWMLNQVLRSFGVFSGLLSELRESKLCMNYIFELETVGLWEWAIYVAQFLPREEHRESCTRHLLARHLDDSFYLSMQGFEASRQTRLDFLTNYVRIPREWISAALAIHAKNSFIFSEEIAQYGQAAVDAEDIHNKEDYIKSFCFTVNEFIAPQAILNGETAGVLGLLETYSNVIRRTANEKEPWAMKSCCYLLYAQLTRDFEQRNEQAAFDAERFVEDLFSLNDKVIEIQTLPSKHDRLDKDVAGEIGTWIRLRNIEISLVEGNSRTYNKVLNLPAREESMRTAIIQCALNFIEHDK